MQFDGRLSRAKRRPWKQRQTEIDGRGIQGIDRLVQIESQILVGIQRTSDANEGLGKIGVDAPVAALVSLGQRVTGNGWRANAYVIQLAVVSLQASLDIAKALPMRELGKRHDEILIKTTKSLHVTLALITGDDPTEFV